MYELQNLVGKDKLLLINLAKSNNTNADKEFPLPVAFSLFGRVFVCSKKKTACRQNLRV